MVHQTGTGPDRTVHDTDPGRSPRWHGHFVALGAMLAGVAAVAGLFINEQRSKASEATVVVGSTTNPSALPVATTGAAVASKTINPISRRALVAIKASSTDQQWQDGSGNVVSYNATNAVDQIPSTAWRPTEGRNVGEWIEFDLGSATEISRVGLLPGYNKVDAQLDKDWFYNNRRIKTAHWILDGADPIIQNFDTGDRSVQYVDFERRSVTNIRVLIAAVTTYGELDHTAISEVEAWG